MLTSRYALAIQHENGDPLDTPVAALRTACLTGVAQARWPTRSQLPSGGPDADRGRSRRGGGRVAHQRPGGSNVDGQTVPAGFTRIVAYRSGLSGDRDLCYKRFK